jgi:hypothetical protein
MTESGCCGVMHDDQHVDGGHPIGVIPGVELFDGDDVDIVGERAPEGDELTAAELAGILASQADLNTSSADAEAN